MRKIRFYGVLQVTREQKTSKPSSGLIELIVALRIFGDLLSGRL